MNASNLTRGRALLLGIAGAICLWLLIPHTNKEVVFEQLSPGFIHNRFVIDATTWPLKESQRLSQRMWIPSHGVSSIEFAIDCPSEYTGLPSLTLYTDQNGTVDALFYRSAASLVSSGEICLLHYEVPEVRGRQQAWIWATLVPGADETPILLYREQSVANYPGGDLLLLPAQKHITSVLAFRLLSQSRQWDMSWPRLLLMIVVAILLCVVVESKKI